MLDARLRAARKRLRAVILVLGTLALAAAILTPAAPAATHATASAGAKHQASVQGDKPPAGDKQAGKKDEGRKDQADHGDRGAQDAEHCDSSDRGNPCHGAQQCGDNRGPGNANALCPPVCPAANQGPGNADDREDEGDDAHHGDGHGHQVKGKGHQAKAEVTGHGKAGKGHGRNANAEDDGDANACDAQPPVQACDQNKAQGNGDEMCQPACPTANPGPAGDHDDDDADHHEGEQVKGHDAKGHHRKGHDANGDDEAKGHQVNGHEVEGHHQKRHGKQADDADHRGHHHGAADDNDNDNDNDNGGQGNQEQEDCPNPNPLPECMPGQVPEKDNCREPDNNEQACPPNQHRENGVCKADDVPPCQVNCDNGGGPGPVCTVNCTPVTTPVTTTTPTPTPTTTTTTTAGNAGAAPTVPVDQGTNQVAGTQARSATASLRAPSRCQSRVFRVTVAGRSIRRVTFFVAGRRVRTVTVPAGRRSITVSLPVRRFGARRQSVRARVSFRNGAAARTLTASASRCAQGAVSPQFTG